MLNEKNWKARKTQDAAAKKTRNGYTRLRRRLNRIARCMTSVAFTHLKQKNWREWHGYEGRYLIRNDTMLH